MFLNFSSASKTPPQPPLKSPQEDGEQQNPPKIPSAIIINSNEDILVEILLRLPLKSLLRLQTVSKQWLSNISGSTFRRQYFTRSSSSSATALFLVRNQEVNFISFGEDCVNSMGNITVTDELYNFLEGRFLKLHSCNGLLCMVLYSNYDHAEFIVYNPSTSQYRIIPQCQIDLEKYQDPVLNIAFDPLKSDHYKLICILEHDSGDRFLVYSSETGIWRDIGERMETDTGELFYFENGVMWNGDLLLDWF